MPSDYRNNHYVPVWYQKRFIPSGQQNRELYYLDFTPDTFKDPRGIMHSKKAVRRQGPTKCLVQKDLYTTQFGATISTDIEQHFLGEIDQKGRPAADYFENFTHPSADGDMFTAMMKYMSTQKLRTPKGLLNLA